MSENREPDTSAPAAERGAPAGPGARLRVARETQSLSIAEVSAKLRLNAHLIEALESNDFAKLPVATFVRGYLRNYARLLGLKEAQVLADYESVGPASPPPLVPRSTQGELIAPRTSWWGYAAAAIVALIAGLALFMWVGRDALEPPVAATSEFPATSLPVPETGGGVGDSYPVLEPIISSLVETPAVAQPEVGSIALVIEENTVAANAPFTDNATVDTPVETVATESPAPPESAETPPVTEPVLMLQFDADCWIEVRDADRRRLAFGIQRAGVRLELRGKPPFAVVLGNAAGVQVSYNGETFNHVAHTAGNIARFRVGE